jgi:hypothetical protein
LESFIRFHFDEDFVVLVLAIGVPQVVLDVVGVDLLQILPPLLVQLDVEVHGGLGAAPTRDNSIVLLVLQPLLRKFKLKLQFLSELLERVDAVMLVLDELNVLNF